MTARSSDEPISKAFFNAPTFAGYTGCTAIASPSSDGSDPVPYQTADNAKYLYAKIYTVHTITASAGTSSTITPNGSYHEQLCRSTGLFRAENPHGSEFCG